MARSRIGSPHGRGGEERRWSRVARRDDAAPTSHCSWPLTGIHLRCGFTLSGLRLFSSTGLDDAPPRESVATGTYRPLPPWILTRMVGVHGAPRCRAYSRSSGRAPAAAPPSPEAANQRRRAPAGHSYPGSGQGRLASMELRGAAPTRVHLGCLWGARAVPGEGALHFVKTCEVR